MEQTTVSIGNKEIQLFEKDQTRILVWKIDSVFCVLKTQGLNTETALLVALSVQADEK